MELTAEGTFERNTKAVGSALRTIKRAEPEAVVMVGTYGPCAEFIKLAHKSGFDPVFVNISFVGANALRESSAPRATEVIVSQVVPFPWDTSVKVVADYQAAEKALDPNLEPEFVSLEGLSFRTPCCLRAGAYRTESDTRDMLRSSTTSEVRHQWNDHEPSGRRCTTLPARSFSR